MHRECGTLLVFLAFDAWLAPAATGGPAAVACDRLCRPWTGGHLPDLGTYEKARGRPSKPGLLHANVSTGA
jgi:hypothetical protein